MNFFERCLYYMQYQTAPQTSYSWFHLTFVGITIVLTFILAITCRNASKKKHRIILFLIWLVMFLFEAYKQLVFSLVVVDKVATWQYSWSSFPFQFCSMPIYVLPFAIIIGNEKINEFFESFLSTYCLFAGIAVMAYPGTALSTTILGVAIQSMVHHGLMVVLGVYLLVHNRKKLRMDYFSKGIVTFIVLVVIAFVLNESLNGIAGNSFNMFYISMNGTCLFPMLDYVKANTPYIVFVLIYVFGFTLAAFVVFAVASIFRLLRFENRRKMGRI